MTKTHKTIGDISIAAFTIIMIGIAVMGFIRSADLTQKQADEAHEAMITSRCMVHGDFNDADAWCHYIAEKEMSE